MAVGKVTAKVARREKEVRKKTYGEMVKIIDLSGIDKFCPITGGKLPTRGMVVRYEGVYYSDWRASELAANRAG